MDELKNLIREIPDYPKPGILFYDITTLLRDPAGLKAVIDGLEAHYGSADATLVVGMEARGFIFAPTLAYSMKAGFVPVRKPKKLPGQRVGIDYALEYGTDRLEIHEGAIEPGQRVVIVDDLLATGGTALATAKLVEQVGGVVAGLGFVIELTFLNGRSKLEGYDVFSLIQYSE